MKKDTLPAFIAITCILCAIPFSGTTNANQNREGLIYTRPKPSSKPVFLRDTLEIELETKNTYWKFPNQNDYTSWIPRVAFEVLYDNSAKLRFTADWTNPDGSHWFTESLDYIYSQNTARLASEYSDELMQTKASAATGTYGLKLTNSKTNEVVFQGRFKVNKMLSFPGDARSKNRFEFYVDNDWNLPIGYVGFNYSGTSWSNPQPIVFMWFKGRLEAKDFEARLFHNGEEIASTDDDGIVNTDQTRGRNCLKFVNVCQFHQYEFYWNKFIVENSDWVRRQKPNATFTRDKPGEYTVKVFHKGIQVRETSFAINPDGSIARNAYSDQMPLNNYKIVVPVKIMGGLDKWSPATWKMDAFYGNPISGFAGL